VSFVSGCLTIYSMISVLLYALNWINEKLEALTSRGKDDEDE